jgi:cell division protein FtsN
MIYQSNRQAGGTLLGLVIGLIIGLAVAVGVAITIKNTPLPFVNKLGKQDKTPDKSADKVAPPNTSNAPAAPPASPPGPSDPNKPLYGNREAARQAAKDVPRKTEEEQAIDAELEARKQEAQREEAKRAEAKARADARAAVRAEAAKPSIVERSTMDKADGADTADEKFTYYLQAGAFLERSDAENAKAKLALMGIPANIAERKTDNGTLYRVRLGPFGKLETMNRVRSRLSDNGVDVAVVRVPK